ncbi:YheO-like domain-containing protein [Coriobacterium glomerans PW2]|uniref:YheO-like domain-containing protein n=1 Tax=Coriobacterium glomerans (strain ATCC 49209 / DSM 20642 / JCM 10262 / PW2) TaxID=700015 RepID=F2NA20_CORGP|nr:PAS domain-containing protein [Coriobacterium glomerans]AEB06414.1 YheO-like domain-containing protein [Coriobacterium glomerans PW2]
MSATIDEYRKLVHFLGIILGNDYEIVLHWRDSDGSYYIAEIEHSYISGRNINSPITDLALELVKNKTYLKQDYVSGYKATSSGKKSVQGSTYFIKDETGTSLQGMLCINFDPSRYVQLANSVLSLTGLDDIPIRSLVNGAHSTTESNSVENAAIEMLHSSVDDSIRAIVDTHLMDPNVTLTQETRMKIVQALYDKGVFQIKGALPNVAKILNVSDQTIYRYLRMIDK